jgi:hypothetical protein
MSKNLDQVQEIATLLPSLKKAREAVVDAEKRVKILELRHGQDTVCVRFLGLDVPVTVLTERSVYMPVKVQGRQALLDACLRAAQDDLILCRSRVEGLEHKLRQLAKGQS